MSRFMANKGQDRLRVLTQEDLGSGIVVRKVWTNSGVKSASPPPEPGPLGWSPYYLVTLTFEEAPVEIWSTPRSWAQKLSPPTRPMVRHPGEELCVEATVKPVAQNEWRVAPEGVWEPSGLVGTYTTPEEALEACVTYLRRWDAARRLMGASPAEEQG